MTSMSKTAGRPTAMRTTPLFRMLRDLLQTLRQHWKQQRTLAELERLDERTLRDIGISRSEIRAIALGDPDRRQRG